MIDTVTTTDLAVFANGLARLGGMTYSCVLGRSGITADKREGDLATPLGIFPLRQVFYRADHGPAPVTALPCRALIPQDGWCDDSADPAYNCHVRLPYAGRHERLWREDGVYDLVLVVGYNDNPVVPDRGSAIFIHLARPDFSGTEGCVAFARHDLLVILAQLSPDNRVIIRADALIL
jgi:L,D-peptidoglycan transpeptidase YkuD (ErfK/YbiS/YcfS/YnhG family)